MLDRVFMKKTRRGNILKIVREHYLRDDISCGSESCANQACKQSFKKITNFLSANPESLSNLFEKPHYLVPDTNIILHQVNQFKI